MLDMHILSCATLLRLRLDRLLNPWLQTVKSPYIQCKCPTVPQSVPGSRSTFATDCKCSHGCKPPLLYSTVKSSI